MLSTKKYGSWACVVGAGEGLGKAFALGLGKRGFHLIIVDKEQSLLDSVATVLKQDHLVEVEKICLDLNEKSSVQCIISSLSKNSCRFLVYNAAYGPVKPFLSNSAEELHAYLNVNTGSLLLLVHEFIRLFKDKSAGILMLSSLAGFRGTQFVVPYAATKAFIWNLAEGLHYEFKESNIDFSVCCPGATATPNFLATKPKSTWLSPKAINPELVAEEALLKFGRQLFIIPGLSNKVSHFILNRMLPRQISSSLHNYVMKKMYY